jgi:hypothetical protein
MIRSLLRFFNIIPDTANLDKYEPIYGLPTHSLDEWLSQNPELKKSYDVELRARKSRRRDRSKSRRGGRIGFVGAQTIDL